MHSPSGEAELDAARARLAFQELLALQLKLLLQRNMAWWVQRRAGMQGTPCAQPWPCAKASLHACSAGRGAAWHADAHTIAATTCRAEVGGGAASVRPGSLLELAVEALPFELTQGQQSALDSILAQMEGWPPMQCLLQASQEGRCHRPVRGECSVALACAPAMLSLLLTARSALTSPTPHTPTPTPTRTCACTG